MPSSEPAYVRPSLRGPSRRRRRRRSRGLANLRYLAALLSRFRTTLTIAAVLYGLLPLYFVWLFRTPGTRARISYGAALHHVYFLQFGQPSLPYVDNWAIEAVNMLVPPLAIAVVVDGLVRFAYLYFAKRRSDKEWIAVSSQSMTNHVVVCGAGRVGYRVSEQLLALGRDVVVIEKREDAAFVAVLRDEDVAVLIDDIKSPQCLPRVNIQKAHAIVCATDDDLANLNVALDARKLNPGIRVVMRLFDDDLVAKVRDTFRAEALSSSALAAPVMALSALDPRVVHSFQVGEHILVVSRFVINRALAGQSVAVLRDKYGGLALAMRRGDAAEVLHPTGETALREGDVLTLQAEYRDYLALREVTGEARAPLSSSSG
jgi:Trk K+ transport system NAD-binding subunit